MKDGAVLFLILTTFMLGKEYHLTVEYDVTKMHYTVERIECTMGVVYFACGSTLELMSG